MRPWLTNFRKGLITAVGITVFVYLYLVTTIPIGFTFQWVGTPTCANYGGVTECSGLASINNIYTWDILNNPEAFNLFLLYLSGLVTGLSAAHHMMKKNMAWKIRYGLLEGEA